MAKRSVATQTRHVLALLAALVCGSMGIAPTALAARPSTANREGAGPRWHVVETASFRILNFGCVPVDRQTAATCEGLRDELTREWLGSSNGQAWSPKCDVVLHSTDKAYLNEVGQGGRNTVASALVDRKAGRIVLRRIDVRATRPDWQSAALPHELAHVVLADRFAAEALPRWLDEGIAILADPHDKQQRHRRGLDQAMSRGAHFRLAELLALGDYPPADRWAAFYGQSASLVEYLVAQQGHGRFVEFVELAMERGYDHALREVYRVGIGELERNWQRALTTRSEVTVESRPQKRGAASEPTSAG